MYGLQFDIITIMDIRDINTHLIVLLGFHSFRERHCLCLHLAIGVKLGNGLYTLVGRHDGWEAAVGIVFELLDGNTTAETAAIRQLTSVVEEIAVPFIVCHTAMVGKRLRITQRHNLASILPRTSGRWSCTIRDMLRHSTGCIQ